MLRLFQRRPPLDGRAELKPVAGATTEAPDIDVAVDAAPAVSSTIVAPATDLAIFRLYNVARDAVGSVDDETRRCVARAPHEGETIDEIVLFCPRANTVFGFFVLAEQAPRSIAVLSDPLVAPVLSFILDRTLVPGRVAFRSPTAPRFICATPVSDSADADLNCNRDGAGLWESFTLDRRPETGLHAETLRLLRSIQRLFEAPVTASAFMAWVQSEPSGIVRGCALAVLRLMHRDDQKMVAVRCLQEDGFLQKLIPDGCTDRWLTETFPELRRWNVERGGPSQLMLDQSWDFLARQVGWNRVTSTGEVLHSLAREAIDPRHGVCVMTTARNEGIYFLEWIAHHRAIGVEHFFVYSNDNNDGSNALLSRLAELGLITWIDNKITKGVDLQTRAYTHCLTHLRQPLDYQWTILIDLDEFILLNPDRHASLPDFLRLQASRGADAVSMNWSMYTPSAQARWDPRPMLERFTYREPQENRTVKTAFVTRLHTSSWPHNPAPSYRRQPMFLNAAGRLHYGPGSAGAPYQGEPTFDDAWIGHYFFKSLDEYIWKTARGFDLRQDLSFNVTLLAGFLRWFDPSSSVQDRRALHHRDALHRELERLRALPGLADAEAAARQNFAERVAAMKVEAQRAIEAFDGLDAATKSQWIGLLYAEPVGEPVH